MYSSTDNKQASRSRRDLADALLVLMRKYPYDEITVTQICQGAKVVRQTFYRHFETKNDVMEYILDSMFHDKLVYDLSRHNTAQDMLADFYAFMLPHKKFLVLVDRNNLFHFINKTIAKNLPAVFDASGYLRFTEPEFSPYVTGFISSTVCSVLTTWVRGGFAQDPVTLSGLTGAFFAGLAPSLTV